MITTSPNLKKLVKIMRSYEYKRLPYVSESGVKVGSMLVRRDNDCDALYNFGVALSIDEPIAVGFEDWVYTTVIWDTGCKTYHLNGTEKVVSL